VYIIGFLLTIGCLDVQDNWECEVVGIVAAPTGPTPPPAPECAVFCMRGTRTVAPIPVDCDAWEGHAVDVVPIGPTDR
jgi:hypothetical protein